MLAKGLAKMPVKCEGCGRYFEGCTWDLDSRAIKPVAQILVIFTILIFGIVLVSTSKDDSYKMELGAGLIGLAFGVVITSPRFKLNSLATDNKLKEAERRLERLDNLEEMERGLASRLAEVNAETNVLRNTFTDRQYAEVEGHDEGNTLIRTDGTDDVVIE